MVHSIFILCVFCRSVSVKLHHRLAQMVDASVGVVSATVGVEPLTKDALVTAFPHNFVYDFPSGVGHFRNRWAIKFRACFKTRAVFGRCRVSLHTMGWNFLRHAISPGRGQRLRICRRASCLALLPAHTMSPRCWCVCWKSARIPQCRCLPSRHTSHR